MKVWFDTDIGGDIDDALALLLAMASNEIELLGVSTVFENTKARAQIVKKLLKLGGFTNVPVYAGIGKPYNATKVYEDDVILDGYPKTYTKEVFGNEIVEDVDCIEQIAKCLRENDDVNIVATGALTNISELIIRYPEECKKIKCLYIMGGAIKLNLNEFNFTCDPEAASNVISSDIKKKLVTLDCTFKCELSDEQINKLKSCESELVKRVMDMHSLWGYGMILHDPLTMGVLLDDFVKFEKGNILVEVEGKYSAGKCCVLSDFNWKYEGRDDLLISSDVDYVKFTNFYVNRICLFDNKIEKGEK